ncbi:MAG TPA: permease [Candidatus Omnitrophota bacterium]|nr:permease [Candidatus Omnitrophota bacterium]HPT07575.1 permease [Candidatus Omnitrophota bacterium]
MIKPVIDWLVYDLLKMRPGSLFSEAVDFFLYDTIKIFMLLAGIIFIVAVIRTFFTAEKTRAILSHKHGYWGNVLAALLGVVTPFCSCSAVPLFLGFLDAGVPLGVTFSFLVASPMINEVALVMLWGLFGWKISVLYIVSGLGIAILSGLVLGRLNVEDLVEHTVSQQKAFCCTVNNMSFRDRIVYAKGYMWLLLKSIWFFVLIGIGLGAWIHGFVPADFLATYAGRGNWFAVPLATLIGIPLYSNAAGVIPLVSALTEKGVAMGTALSFMMAVTALSLPEFIILRRAMKVKLLIIFASVVGIGIIFTGYLFNAILR